MYVPESYFDRLSAAKFGVELYQNRISSLHISILPMTLGKLKFAPISIYSAKPITVETFLHSPSALLVSTLLTLVVTKPWRLGLNAE